MAQDWASDVRKFAPDADDGVIAGIVRYCGIALQKPDSALVSYTDPVELGRVRNNFLKKKLALDHGDDVLDAAIARVGERMKGVNFKNRVTVYYLLLDDLGLTHLFAKKGSAAANAAPLATPAAAAGAVAAVGASAAKKTAAPRKAKIAAAPIESAPDETTVMATSATPATVAAVTGMALGGSGAAEGLHSAPWGVARLGTMPSVEGPGVTPGRFGGGDDDGKLVWGWLWLTLAALAVMALFVLLLPRGERQAAVASAASAPAADVTGDGAVAVAPASAPAAVPDGAGIVSETRDAKPVVKVYFDTGKADVAPTFAIAAAPLKTWLAANAGSRIGISGYNDPTGNAAANAALSKRRAQAVQAALVSAGIAAGSIDLVKPDAATDAATTAAEARRVEAYIK